MRELTAKQKKLLDKWYEENKNKDGVGYFFNLGRCEAFSLGLLEKLEEINDSEVLYQEINSYISDKVVLEPENRGGGKNHGERRDQ